MFRLVSATTETPRTRDLRTVPDRSGTGAGARGESPRPGAGAPEDPRPVAGCAPCSVLVGYRRSMRAAGDHSRASDANVLLRRHLNEGTHG